MRKTDYRLSLDRTGTPVTSEAIEPTRLRTILDRLASGFYSRPEVLDRIAERVARDLA